MDQKRLEEITKRIEESPHMPYMCLRDEEAVEAAELLRRRYRTACLVMLWGVRYIAVTDEALNVILERLERERCEFAKILERYNRDMAGVRKLLGNMERKRYWSAASVYPEPGDRREWTGSRKLP